MFPVIVFGIWALGPSRSRRQALLAFLAVVIGVSAWWCAHQTHSDPVTAYYSPFTRFWELGLGALVVTLPPTVQLRGRTLKATAGWIAFAAVVASAFAFTDKTQYPGVAVWWPVGATAMVLLAGRQRSGFGPELLLERRPATFMGDISFALYLWHYPLLMIPMLYSVTGDISLQSRLELILAAVVLSIISYYVVENPIRRSKALARRPGATFVMGAVLIGSVWLAISLFEQFSAV